MAENEARPNLDSTRSKRGQGVERNLDARRPASSVHAVFVLVSGIACSLAVPAQQSTAGDRPDAAPRPAGALPGGQGSADVVVRFVHGDLT